MGGKAILVLAGAVCALAAVLYFTDRNPPAKASNEVAALDGRRLGDCARIRWQFEGRPGIEVVRRDDGMFWLAEPIVDLASPGYLQQIVGAWDSAQLRRTPLLDDDEGRRKAGLLPPALTFTVDWPDGHVLTLDIGEPSPLGNGRFVRRDGVIWEGSEGLLTSLEVGLEDLRDRSVFRNGPQTCRELLVTQQSPSGKSETLQLVRKGGTDWRLAGTLSGRADADAALSYVTAVLSLRVGDFVHGLHRPPEGPPEIVIEARGGMGDERLELWLDQGSIWGTLPGRGIGFSSDNRTYSQVFVNAAERLRARILVPMRVVAEELGEVVIDAGGGQGDRVRLQRDGNAADWRLHEPIEFATHPTPVNELVQAINNLHAIEFVDGKDANEPSFGLGQGRLSMTVRALQQRETTTLWFGNTVRRGEDDFVYACRADEPGTVVLVPATPVELLRRAFTEYCNREVVRGLPVVERLELQSQAGQLLVYLHNGKEWVKEGDPQPRGEVGSFVNDVLRDLRGERAIDLRDGAFGDPDWLLLLRRNNGDTFAELRLWDRSKQGGMVVQPKGQSAIGFDLSEFIAKSLRELMQ